MKSLVKNIVIAAEFVIIAVLLAAVIRLYPEKKKRCGNGGFCT